jgi:hypothetical protein
MRRFIFAAPLALAVAIAAYAWADSPITKTDNAALNYIRPCSYSGKTPTTISVSGSSAATSSALSSGRVVRLVCNTAVHFRMSTTASPTALSTDSFLPANTVEWFVSEGDYVAAIQDSASGTCYLTECR